MIIIDSFPYDLVVSGELTFESDITDYPVEEGGHITDHIRTKPFEIELESIVSDTPIGEIAKHESRRIDDVTEAVLGTEQIPLPSAEAYDRLTTIWKNGDLVTIEIPTQRAQLNSAFQDFAGGSGLEGLLVGSTGKTNKRTFINMALESLSIPISNETDGCLHFTARFKQVTIVRNKRVNIKVSVPRGAGGKSTTKAPFKVDTDSRIIWNMRTVATLPDGTKKNGYLDPHHPWAVVRQQAQKAPAGQPSVTVFNDWRYFWGEPSSHGDPTRIPIPYNYKAGEPLTDAERDAFLRDRGDDFDAERAGRKKYTTTAVQGPDINHRAIRGSLPEGVDQSRFVPDDLNKQEADFADVKTKVKR